jgi:hypothetical protein
MSEQLKDALRVAACRYPAVQRHAKPTLLKAWLEAVVDSKPCKCSLREGFIELIVWLKSDPSYSLSSLQIK